MIVPFRSVPTRRAIEYSKTKAKNFQKLKYTIMASFQAKEGWKRPRKREKKNCHSVLFCSYSTRNRKFKKSSNKIQKIKIYYYGFISSQNRVEKAEKGKK